MNHLLALQLYDASRITELLLGLGFDLSVIAGIAYLTYRRSSARSVYVFSLVVVNIVVFFATYVMTTASVSVNVGFGLFALFGILRFRTGTLPVLEMTYLFAGIALASFNALAVSALTLAEAGITNLVVLLVLEGLGGVWLSRQAQTHTVVYEKIDLIHPRRRAELIADLERRTGLAILGVTVGNINFLNDTARITIRVKPTPETLALLHTTAEIHEQVGGRGELDDLGDLGELV